MKKTNEQLTKVDNSRVRVIETFNETDYGRFATTRGPHKCYHFSWLDLERNTLKKKGAMPMYVKLVYRVCKQCPYPQNMFIALQKDEKIMYKETETSQTK